MFHRSQALTTSSYFDRLLSTVNRAEVIHSARNVAEASKILFRRPCSRKSLTPLVPETGLEPVLPCGKRILGR